MKTEEDNIYNKYNDLLYNYIKMIYPGLKQLLREERAPYLKQIEVLSDLFNFMNYLIDTNKDLFVKDIHRPLALFYIKIASDVISIRQCLLLGQSISAFSIERNLFETFVDVSLILQKDSNERLRLYEDYQKVLLWLRYQEYKEYIEKLELDKDVDSVIINEQKAIFYESYTNNVIDSITKNYDEIRSNYHPTNPYHWAWKIFNESRKGRNPNIKSICQEIGLYDDYLHVYGTNSLAVHNQPLMANFLMRDGNLTSIPNFSSNTSSVAGLTMSFAIETIIKIFQYISIPNFEEIKLFLNVLFKKHFLDK